MTEFLQEAIRQLAPESAEVLTELCRRTFETAARMNITARKSEAEIVFYHVADSLSLSGDVRGLRRVCDVGTGGGFPGLVLACLCPDTEFVLMDATQKKVVAIQETAQALGLDNVTPLCARAEEAGRSEARDSFDAVVSRALAALPMLAELCLPLVKAGGRFFAMKGPRAVEEIEAARPILSRLGVALPKMREEVTDAEKFLSLAAEPSADERRALEEFCAMARTTLIFEKKKSTPRAYPRVFAQIRRGGV